MERLTKCENGKKSFNCYGCEKLGGDCDPGDCNKQAVSRLEAIEEILGPTYDISRIKELVEADRKGNAELLPCKIGDTIYAIRKDAVIELTVESIHCYSGGYWKVSAHTDKRYSLWTMYDISFYGFGKEIFLTNEEAERALEVLNG